MRRRQKPTTKEITMKTQIIRAITLGTVLSGGVAMAQTQLAMVENQT